MFREVAYPTILLSLLATACGGGGGGGNPVQPQPPAPPPAAKTSARYTQAPWDVSVFFGAPGGGLQAPDRAAGDNLTGNFTNSNGFGGTLRGVLTGTLESGSFDGTLITTTDSGCSAERRYTGPLTASALNWTPGEQVNDCGGASPLSAPVQAPAAPPSAPPCSFSASLSEDPIGAAGGTRAATISAGSGCAWFTTSTASWVTITSGGQGTGSGSVNLSIAPNTGPRRTATVVLATKSFTVTQEGAPTPCSYDLSPDSVTLSSSGGTGSTDVRTGTSCGWSATSNASWLTITGGPNGTGNGSVSFSATSNPGGERTGTLTIAGETFTVIQAGVQTECTYQTNVASVTAPATGGSSTVTITTGPSCSWSTSISVPWISVAPSSGTGSGTVALTIASHTAANNRTGVVTIGGRSVTVTQAGVQACSHSLSSTSSTQTAQGGTISVNVTASLPSCAWTAVANDAFVSLSGPTSGTGNGVVNIVVAQNGTSATRTGTVSIAGQTFTVSQTGTLLRIEIVGSGRGDIERGSVAVLVCGGPGGTVCEVPTAAGSSVTLSTVSAGFAGWEAPASCVGTSRECVFTPQVGTNLVRARFNAAPASQLQSTFNPNPAPYGDTRGCGLPGGAGNPTWYFSLTVATTGPALTVADAGFRFFNASGQPAGSSPLSAAEFQQLFRTNQIPNASQGTASANLCVYLAGNASGYVELYFNGSDVSGFQYSLTTSRLQLLPATGTQQTFLAGPPPSHAESGGTDTSLQGTTADTHSRQRETNSNNVR